MSDTIRPDGANAKADDNQPLDLPRVPSRLSERVLEAAHESRAKTMRQDAKFLGDRLRHARLLSGLNLQELGEKISSTRQFISQLEGGKRFPREDHIEIFCEALRVTRGFFFTPENGYILPEECHFRKRRTTSLSLTNRVVAKSTLIEQLIEFMHENLVLPQENIPSLNGGAGPKYTNAEIESAALGCRHHWGLGIDTPIPRVTRVLENAGIIIAEFRGIAKKIDAFSVNRKYPVIVRNSDLKNPCRTRFDYAHELGHFVLHDGAETGDMVTEREADAFASAFLFPNNAFLREFPKTGWGYIDWNALRKLKIRWGISFKAMIFKAHQLNLISTDKYKSSMIQLSKSGQAKIERHDNEVLPDHPEILEKAFMVLRQQLGMSFEYVASQLHICPELLTQVTGVEPDDESYLANVIPISNHTAQPAKFG